MRAPFFLLLGLLLVAPGHAADPRGSALRTVLSTTADSVRSADPTGDSPGQLIVDSRPDSVRFEAIDVFLDSGKTPLAAYQFELKAKTGEVLLAGLEGGAHPAFNAAPYYDPAALLNNKVIVAAFSTAADLPHGRTRVARLMVQVSGHVDPAYDAVLSVAGSTDGKAIPNARVSVETEQTNSTVPTARGSSQPSPAPTIPEGVVR